MNQNECFPLVSVIMPVYNRGHLVEQSLDSVFEQNYSNLEVIVVNDGSTDNSGDVLRSYGDRIVLIEQENAGAYSARNKALQVATGQLFAFIDADDIWLKDKLEKQIQCLRDPEIGLVFGNAIYARAFNERWKPTELRYFDIFPPSKGFVSRELGLRNFICQSSVLVRRECFAEYGNFSLANPRGMDFAKWFQLSFHYKFDYVSEPLVLYGIHDSNLSFELGALANPPVQPLEEMLRSGNYSPVDERVISSTVFYVRMVAMVRLLVEAGRRFVRCLMLKGVCSVPIGVGKRISLLIWIIYRLGKTRHAIRVGMK